MSAKSTLTYALTLLTRIATVVLLCCFLLSASVLSSQDTFSIIAADPETGEIGAAGASCVDNIAGLGGIQLLNKIIPGRGGVNAQAYVCISPHINLDNAIARMEDGLNPDEVLDWLQNNDACFSQNFNPSYRQYGIVDFTSTGEVRTAAFTGANCDNYKGHRTGTTYAIQGNILLGPEVLDGMENGFNNTTGSLAERLMAAMQGANFAGADTRCLARGTSSTSAFLRVARPDDDRNDPYLELNVLEMPFGEEPIDSLQSLFDAWVTTGTQEFFGNELRLFPNPSRETLHLKSPTTPLLSWQLYSLTGQRIAQQQLEIPQTELDLNLDTYPTGVYWLQLEAANGQRVTRRVVRM